MNNSSMEAKYVDPDLTSALLVGVWWVIVGIFGIPLNIFIIVATVKVREIRAVSSNMFIASLAVSDAIFLFCLSLHLPYALTSSEQLCRLMGYGDSTSVVLSGYIPPFLALNRYAIVCRQDEKLARILFKGFSRKGTYWMIFLLWAVGIMYLVPFVIFNTSGLHNAGLCTTVKKSANNTFIRVYYYCGVLGVLALSNIPLFICYRKVSSWVKAMSAKLSLSVEAKETVRETENALLLTKWVTFMPFIFGSPSLILAALFEFNSEIVSIGLARLFISLYPLIPLFNAIVTLKFARPYRLEFKKICDRTKLTSILFSWMIEGRLLYKVDVVFDITASVL